MIEASLKTLATDESIPATDQVQKELSTSESTLEVIKVSDSKRDKEHYILIETTISRLKHYTDKRTIFETASISCRASYIFGDHQSYIGKRVSDMGGKMNHYDQTIRLTNGSVMIDQEELRGLHIGTYLFHKIVTWAKSFDPNYKIIPISLSVVDASDANKDRRNTFYENFGLVFNYRVENGKKEASGHSIEMLTVKDLLTYQNWPNIESINKHEALRNLAQTIQRLKSSQSTLHMINRHHVKSKNKNERKIKMIAMWLNWPFYILIGIAAFTAGKLSIALF